VTKAEKSRTRAELPHDLIGVVLQLDYERSNLHPTAPMRRWR
jgi:hypothetical protein